MKSTKFARAYTNHFDTPARGHGRTISPPRPIIVAGMHRSGTSWFASLLTAAGINMGEQLVEADIANPRGYFEDTAFLDINRKMLFQATPEVEGHRDWGWTLTEQLDRQCFGDYTAAADTLISKRNGLPGGWGWKDPRTTLTLDFWHQLLTESGCDPLYIFLYRFPWDVADSMQRLGADVFLRNPEYAYRIWSFYNRSLLSFYENHRDCCLLLSTNALWHDPERSRSLLTERMGLQLPSSLESVNDHELWHERSGVDPLVALTAVTSPDCLELLTELDRCADISAADFWTSPSHTESRRLESGDQVDLSVVIPCYNHGEFLIEAIASVERFAPHHRELIIVNDGSEQPRTIEVLRLLRNKGYTVIDQPHSGLSAARNRGIALTRGRYILPLDADNRICSGFAGEAIQFLDGHTDVGVVYGDRYDFGRRRGRASVADFDLDRLLLWNYIDACAIYRKSVWSDCGGYDVELSALEDWELWIAASERGWRFHRLDAITFEYRVRPDSLVSTTLQPEVSSRLHSHILHKHWSLFLRRIPAIVLRALPEPPPSPTPALEHLIAGSEELSRKMEEDRSRWMARVSSAECELAERDTLLRSLEQERIQWMTQMSLSAEQLLQQNTRLRETEADMAQQAHRCSESEAERRSLQERLSTATALLRDRDEELSAIRTSATWRWSRKALESGPIRWLFGPLIHSVAENARRSRSEHAGPVKAN